jgi:probable HAF family extracellular repeat protein
MGRQVRVNNNGEIAGYAKNGSVDSRCPSGVVNNRIVLPVLWTNGNAKALPAVGTDPDAVAFGLNNQGQAVGYSGTCTTALQAVVWEKNGTAIRLPDLGSEAASLAFGINEKGQIAGQVASPDGTTTYAALWQHGVLTNLGTLPGDFSAFASGINDLGQVVGSTQAANFEWLHGFIWQNGVMTDLNTLFPADSNLYATMANKINDRGQISGMATVLSGPDAGAVHGFLATPINATVGTSIADIAPTHPKSNLPASAGKQLWQTLRLGQIVR